MARILLVDDEPGILNVLSNLLRSANHETVAVRGGEKAQEVLQNENFDLMISDLRMAPVDGMQLLKTVRRQAPSTSVIMLTAYGSVETAVEAMKEGAFDYVTKPFKVDELMITVERALQYRNVLAENTQLKAQLESKYRFENIVAESAAMRKVCEMIERVAPTDTTVLVLGESGTGKEVVAKAIHAHSPRKNKAFVPINCAALPEPLLESELFGHVKGAFTGATSTKEGLFEAAHGGTIFLDEIGSMPLSIQAKLLRVLQDKQIRKVGGTDNITVDVRVLAATNDRLEKMISESRFREDLYYRLSVIPIEISPLRERPEDIMPLVYHFMRQELGADKEMPSVDPDAEIILESYPWPGNVRELENAIRHALTFTREGKIAKDVLPAKMVNFIQSAPPGAGMGAGSVIEDYRGKSLRMFLRQKEKEYLSHVLTSYEGDKEKAAKALKISLATLYRKLPEPAE
jgi:two-component system, NtrC family, response regulator PilR